MQGKFITLEGPEGSGKSTHSRLLAGRLRDCGVTVVETREPGGTPLGEAVRGMLQFNSAGEAPQPTTELLLFCASRAQLTANVIKPALQRGEWVICDRFTDSTLAYQGYGRSIPLPTLRALNGFATGGLVPDITLLFDVDPATSSRRVNARRNAARAAIAPDRFEREAGDFHARIRHGFLELARNEPGRFHVFDTTRPLPIIRDAVWQAVSAMAEAMRPGTERGADNAH